MSWLHKLRDDLQSRIAKDLSPPPDVDTGSVLVVVGQEVRHIAQNGAADGDVLTVDSSAPGNVVWAAPSGGGGGGTSNHAALTNRLWTLSAHTGTANRIAAFDGTGATSYLAVGTDVQAWDADLDAYAALSGTGLVVRTGSGTATTRTITGSGNIVVTNGSGVAGNPNVDGSAFAPKPVTVRYDADGTNWQTWTAPTGHTMCHIVVVGSGGGGADGVSGAEGTARRGGAGGGTAGWTEWTGRIPVSTLHVLVALGGGGGAGVGVAGAAGDLSYVCVSTDTQSIYQLVKSGTNAAQGGQATAGGSAGTAFNGSSRYAGLGAWTGTAGHPGVAGGNPGVGSSVSGPTSISLSAGAGGGGRSAANASSAGGDVLASGLMALVAGGAGSAGGTGTAGGNGVDSGPPDAHTGGAGGGAGLTGGKGGNGALGCGGGGGGAGVTGGIGGDGGHGWVIITSW